MKRIKVITGYKANARFWAETGKQLGYIERQKQIPSPYAYSPTHIVYEYHSPIFGKIPVIEVETSHRRYEVFIVPPEMIKRTEKEILQLAN